MSPETAHATVGACPAEGSPPTGEVPVAAAMPLDRRVELLQKTRLSIVIAGDLAPEMAAAMRHLRHGRGELLIRQGDPGERLFILAAGSAEVRVRSGGGEIVVATLGVGDCFGEMSLLTDEPTSANVLAIEPAETLALDRPAFAELMARRPLVLKAFVSILSRRLRATDTAVGRAHQRERDLTLFLQEEKGDPYGDRVGKHARTLALDREIDRFAALDDPMLISGEPGTGKEMVARLIHRRGRRSGGPFFSVDCARVEETPWGDKLFGARQQDGASEMSITSGGVCYVDLAQGGTLLLHHLENLPPGLQERLAAFLCLTSGSLSAPSLRIIATSDCSPDELRSGGRLTGGLDQSLCANVLQIPALRERKRDIGDLARYFMTRHAARLKKPVTDLDPQAITKLVEYDYTIGNVEELKDAVERAVVIAEDSAIRSEEIFLGPLPRKGRLSVSLLQAPGASVAGGVQTGIRVAQFAAASVFSLILIACFVPLWSGSGGWATAMVWSLWWPALAFSFFFVGRMWCAVCPMAFAARQVQRVKSFNRTIPRWMKDYDSYLAAAGFFLILWVEEITAMRHSPTATGLLLLAIAAGAIATAVLFPRRTWCRHVCPLGGFAGVCSTAALVELRPTPDICSARCSGHTCYKGDARTEGCPMFNHVMFVGTNHTCALCMKCVVTCPNGSPQFNLRVPARELWNGAPTDRRLATFVAMLLGLAAALMAVREGGPGWAVALAGFTRVPHEWWLTGIMVVGAGFPVLAVRAWAHHLARDPNASHVEGFWRALLGAAPLALAAFMAYEIGFIPGLDRVLTSLTLRPEETAWTLPLVAVLRVLILGLGGLTTAAVLWNLFPRSASLRGTPWVRRQIVNLGWTLAYAALLIALAVWPAASPA